MFQQKHHLSQFFVALNKLYLCSTQGPPDVEQACEHSLQAWSPELILYDTNVTSPCPETEGCTLTLHFLHPVIPHRLTLWVTYISASKYQQKANMWLCAA